MLRKKNITLNGKKASGNEKVLEGDVITFFLSDETFDKFSGGSIQKSFEDKEFENLKRLVNHSSYKEFKILYEDDDILVINKPAGLLSQKATNQDISANELFLAYLINSGQLSCEMFRVFRPSIANRLDRNTSGLLLCGKTMKGLQELAYALKERTVKKYYICLVEGIITDSMHIDGYLSKDEKTNMVKITKDERKDAKYIQTSYEPLKNNGNCTLLKVHLITGRTHQIRAHLSYIGHPILGDYKYGNRKLNDDLKKEFGVEYQLLHAYEMIFDNGLHIFAPIPEIFDTIDKRR